VLASIILARHYGAEPETHALRPDLAAMLERCDAALVIGDPALKLDPTALPYHVLDLGAEWTRMTGLPMVFAVWAAHPDSPGQDPGPFVSSLEFGLEHIDDIVQQYHAKVGITAELAREYLTRRIAFQLGEREYEGMSLFLKYAAELQHPTELRVTVS